MDDHIILFIRSNYSMLVVIENLPSHGDTTIGQAFYLAPFVDANANNIYDPFQGDYPDLTRDQALYIIRNDVGNLHSETGAEQMGIEQHLMFYGYKCDDNLAINNSLFVNMKIDNKGPNTLNDFYAGTWLDPDLGFYLECVLDSMLDLFWNRCWTGCWDRFWIRLLESIVNSVVESKSNCFLLLFSMTISCSALCWH